MAKDTRGCGGACSDRGWLAAGVMALAGTTAHAQPGNLGPPNFVNMGDIASGANVYRTGDVASGAFVWFKINLTETIDPTQNWLELDMSGPTTLIDPHMAVYDARANRLFVDDNGGGSCGEAGNGLAPALTFGGGSGLVISRTFGSDWNGGRISTGVDATTLNATTLGAGTYWVCVTASVGSFPDPNPTWGATSNTTLSGSVGLRVMMDSVPATTWNEAQNSVDAGDLPETAQDVVGAGSLTTILCSYEPRSRDMFKIHIDDGANFRAAATVSKSSGSGWRARLYLFDAMGRGVYAISNTVSNRDTVLTRPVGAPPLPVGDYYLAISSVCGGFTDPPINYGPGVPFSAANGTLWSFAPNNEVIAPNGTDPTGSIAYWGRQTDCETFENSYFASISLTGVSHVSGAAPCVADVDDGSGTGTPDGGVSIDDLLYYLQRLADGC